MTTQNELEALRKELSETKAKLQIYEATLKPDHNQPETALEHYWFNKGHSSHKLYENNEYLQSQLAEKDKRHTEINRQLANENSRLTQKLTTANQRIENLRGALERYANGEAFCSRTIAKEALFQDDKDGV